MSACPVDHGKTAESSTSALKNKITEQDKTSLKGSCPVDHTNMGAAAQQEEKCPVDPANYKHFLPAKKGCDSDAINASNAMPSISQKPLPDQTQALGQDREISTIPRANSSDKLWVYPSEQMFYNAMRRKNWEAKETDMPVVVPIHNAVNEQAWQHILEWESMHRTTCNQPKLLKFQGRPKDISPKARFRSWLGYQLPFDRHDWTVDRCGERVTYVIDFYTGKRDPKRPEAVSFYLDVRPAVSVGGVWDRLKMAWRKGDFQ